MNLKCDFDGMRMRRKCVSYLFLIFFLTAHAATGGSELRFNHITVDDGLSQNTVHAIAKDKFGFMWFGTWEGISRFDGYTFKLFRADDDNATALSNNRVNAIVTDSTGNIWVLTGDSRYLFRFNYDKENFTRFVPDKVSPAIRQKLFTYAGSKRKAENRQYSWVITTDGLLQSDKRTGYKTVYHTDRNSPFALSDYVVNALFLDDGDKLWVGTQNGGINLANLRYNYFDYYSVGSLGLHNNVVRAVGMDKTGKLWTGSDADGITVIDRSQPRSTVTRYGKDKLIDPNIRSIYCDRFGYVWIGTKGGLDRFDPRTETFKHYYARIPGSILHPWVFRIMEDQQGNLWVGTFKGIARYDRENDRFLCYDPSVTLISGNVRDMLDDGKNGLWVATERGGLTHLEHDPANRSSATFIPHHYQHVNGKTNSLINDMVLSLARDMDNKLWIGTNSGLCRLDPKTGDFLRFSVANGFPDDLIMGLLTDGKGNVWISHKKGLTRMDIRTFARRTFTSFEGLQGNEFTNACYKNPRTGELFFGGTNGLNAFFPDRISINSKKNHPVLTGLKIMNQPVEVGASVNDRIVLDKSLACTERVILTWQDVNFSIVFSSLDYDNPQGCRFRYILEGMDGQWMYTDASMREATYTHLPAGNYTFKVYASNNDGVWSDQPAYVQIKVLPPWWFSWWAKLFYVILVCFIALLVYRYIASRIEFRNRLVHERLKNEKNEELMNIKLQFFTEISHEFRTPLTLIIDPLERLLSGCSDEEQTRYYLQLMSRNAKQLLELINQLLDFRKLQSKNLPMLYSTADIAAFVRTVASAFEQKAAEQHIRFVVQAATDKLDIDFDTDKMRKILNNLLSNAFRFTPAYGEIIVRVLASAACPDKITIEVQDSGIGISQEHHNRVFDPFYQVSGGQTQGQGSGIGLALTKELVLLHGGEISLVSEKGAGTCFRFSIPCRQESVTTEPSVAGELIPAAPATVVSVLDEESDAERPLVLIVDDNADIREYFNVNFRETYRIASAIDGLDGFNKAIELIPDLIVSDIMMPGIDGIELCKRLKTDEHSSHIPVILLTARQTDESRIEGYETGADAYVTKPFSTQVLGARMLNLLEQRLKLRQLFSNGSPTEFRKIVVNITDESFLNKVVSLMDEHMEESDFDPDKLAVCLKMSRSQLYRKIRALTNRTVHEFMTSIRMNKSKEYLLSGEYSISETAYKVGYSLPTNFTRTFARQFGVSPTKYIERHKK